MATQLAGVPYGPLPRAATAASALAQPPRLVVIHDTSNSATAAAEASYAATRPLSGATSAHFYVDGGGPLGSVPLNIQAWAAYNYANSHGWHIEMCGYNAGTTGAVPAKTIGLTAHLVRQLCDLAGIPMVKLSPADVAAGKRGICGHWDITTGLGVGTHDDPGPRFDWPAFIAAVNGDDDMDAAQFAQILDDPSVATKLRRLAVSYTGGGIPAGMSVLNVLNAIHGAVTGTLVTLLQQAIKEAADDPDLPQVPPMTDEQVAALASRVAAAVNVPTPDVYAAAVLDAESARLES